MNNLIMKLATPIVLIVSSVACTTTYASKTRLNESFKEFTVVGNAKWTVDTHLAAAHEGNGFLVSNKRYDNFYLKVDFQAGQNTNSGIFIRCASSDIITDQTCYEVNIFDSRPDQTYRTGSVTGHASPKVIKNVEDKMWHTYEIYAVDDKLRVILDGYETVYMRNTKLQSGFIALQLAQGEITFRNLSITALPSDAMAGKSTIIDGVWELEAMYTLDKSGKVTPWCHGSFGVIIYTNGFMSTAVNCTSDSNKSVLYAGPFNIEEKTVYHHAQNYSNPSLNKIFSRSFELTDENHLELSGDLGESKVIVKWVRR